MINTDEIEITDEEATPDADGDRVKVMLWLGMLMLLREFLTP